MPICLSSVGNCYDFALVVLNLSWVFLSGYRWVVFSWCCVCFCIIFLDYLLSELFDKQRHLAGNFRGFQRSSLLNILILAISLLSIHWCLVAMLRTVGQFCSLHWQNFIERILFHACFFVLAMLVYLYFFLFLFQLFRLGHWTMWRGC